jgi:large subunit ribosomal protein L29
MRAKELRERSDEELRTMERNFRHELFTARFKNATNRLYDSSELPKKRRDLARVLTILRERETAAPSGSTTPEDEE